MQVTLYLGLKLFLCLFFLLNLVRAEDANEAGKTQEIMKNTTSFDKGESPEHPSLGSPLTGQVPASTVSSPLKVDVTEDKRKAADVPSLAAVENKVPLTSLNVVPDKIILEKEKGKESENESEKQEQKIKEETVEEATEKVTDEAEKEKKRSLLEIDEDEKIDKPSPTETAEYNITLVNQLGLPFTAQEEQAVTTLSNYSSHELLRISFARPNSLKRKYIVLNHNITCIRSQPCPIVNMIGLKERFEKDYQAYSMLLGLSTQTGEAHLIPLKFGYVPPRVLHNLNGQIYFRENEPDMFIGPVPKSLQTLEVCDPDINQQCRFVTLNLTKPEFGYTNLRIYNVYKNLDKNQYRLVLHGENVQAVFA